MNLKLEEMELSGWKRLRGSIMPRAYYPFHFKRNSIELFFLLKN